MNKIVPCLWFNTNAEEAVSFYVSVFANSHVGHITRNPPGGPFPAGSVLTMEFQLEGQDFIALNGGPQYPFTPAISLSVSCATQTEVDTLWERLCSGGQEVQCGWVTDRFGLSWQVVPTLLIERLRDPDPAKAARVMQAMMPMRKLDIDTLERAYQDNAAR